MKDAISIHNRINYLREQICSLLVDEFGFDSAKAKEIAMGNHFISTHYDDRSPEIIREINDMFLEINTLEKEIKMQ